MNSISVNYSLFNESINKIIEYSKIKPIKVTDGMNTTCYFKDGKLHRLDGPAVHNKQLGFKEYWIEGQRIEEEDFEQLAREKKLEEFLENEKEPEFRKSPPKVKS